MIYRMLLIFYMLIGYTFANDNEKHSVEYLQGLAEKGDTKAQNDLGFSYYEGKITQKDPEKCIKWTTLSANNGNADAQINLGYFYSIGFGVNKDVEKTLFWYKKASDQDIPQANYNLGYMYYSGNDVEKDLKKAAEYFKKAAVYKNIPSLVALGGMYVNGEGVEKDGSLGADYLRRAAELGDIQSSLDLGKMYAGGIGVTQNFSEAKQWYEKAKTLGSNEASISLANLPEMELNSNLIQQNDNRKYAKNLKDKYSKRLIYESDTARKYVETFNLDCHIKDGRYLPLENILFAKLASMDDRNSWLVIRVDSRGDKIRIYDDLVGADGRIIYSAPAFEINEWAELISLRVPIESVLNSCFGSFGPIWMTPNN